MTLPADQYTRDSNTRNTTDDASSTTQHKIFWNRNPRRRHCRDNRCYYGLRYHPGRILADKLRIVLRDTLKQLIGFYRTDEHSPFRKLNYAVRMKQERMLARLMREHGNVSLQSIRARTLISWHDNWLGEQNKVAMAHALISLLRVLFRFGRTILEDPECARLLNHFSELRFKKSAPRIQTISSEYAIAFRVQAHERGWCYMALAEAFQFELMLPQKDVVGEWVPISEPGVSDTIRCDKQIKWINGLRWEKIDENLVLRHATSKRHKEIEVDLRLSRMILEDFALLTETPIRKLTRSSLPEKGPVILCEVTGFPYLTAEFRRKWRVVAKTAGIPSHIINNDNKRAQR